MYRRTLIAIAITLAAATASAQQAIDRSAPPVDVGGADGFTVQRLPGRPGIDGRFWMLADVHTGKPELFRPDGADYQLELNGPTNNGDVERWTVTLRRVGNPPVVLTAGSASAFVYVTPDARYIFLEPLIVVDVTAWKRYDLGKALGIAPYVTIRAIRPGGHELFLDRSSCVVDCANRSDEEYFDLTIP